MYNMIFSHAEYGRIVQPDNKVSSPPLELIFRTVYRTVGHVAVNKDNRACYEGNNHHTSLKNGVLSELLQAPRVAYQKFHYFL